MRQELKHQMYAHFKVYRLLNLKYWISSRRLDSQAYPSLKLFGCNLEPVTYDGSTSIAKKCICNSTYLWKSLKSIKIIYYRWDGANYLKYSHSVSTRLQQFFVGVLQLVFFFFYFNPPHRWIIKNASPSISSWLQMLHNVESPEQTALIYSSYCFFVLLGRH